MSLQSPLARARGLGSAKQGTQHFWYQRVTAVLLIPLSVWFMLALIGMTRMDHATVSQWLHSPINAALLIVLLIALFHHAQLGMQVVIEDYIESEWQKVTAIILIKFLAALCAIISVLATIKIYMGL